MENRNNIQDFHQQVNLYFDNALDKESEIRMFEQVHHNQECGKVFDKEKNFRFFIKNNFKRPTAPSSLIESIKEKVRFL